MERCDLKLVYSFLVDFVVALKTAESKVVLGSFRDIKIQLDNEAERTQTDCKST